MLAPWLERWREEIGDVRGDDPQFEAWAEARTDWALVDMGAGQDTIDRDPSWGVVSRSWVGMFEVWPTEGAVRSRGCVIASAVRAVDSRSRSIYAANRAGPRRCGSCGCSCTTDCWCRVVHRSRIRSRS